VITDGPGWGLWLQPILPVRQLVELAAIAEDAGASHVFMADEGTDRDLFVALTAIALRTQHVWLGAGITNPFSRHPLATAAAFASLAELAPGRVILGLGVGGSLVLGPMGLDPARPFTALRETVDVVGRLLDGQIVTHRGTFDLREAEIPWSPGRLPLAMAGRGPRVEQYAVTTADLVLLSGKPHADLPALTRSIRARGAEVGHRAAVAWSAYLGWTPAMVEAIRPHFTYATVDMPPETRQALGIPDEVTERIREVMLRDGIEAAAPLVPDRVVERAAIVGTADSVVEQLREVREAAEPELFLLPIADTASAATFITEAATLLERAGFRSARAAVAS
jgi:5,10-methylenetetrahydromethanopterin reductase